MNNLQLEWFIRNIDYQLEDLKCLSEGIEIKIYFDTADIRDSVLGLHTFYHKHKGIIRDKLQQFNSDKYLVYSLMSANFLGNINLLPPHQAELLSLLKNNFFVELDHADYRELVSRLLRELITGGIINLKKFKGKEHIRQDYLLEEVLNKEGLTTDVFKFLEIVNDVEWKHRLYKYLTRNILIISAENGFNYAEYTSKEDFIKLKSKYDKIRIGKRKNNFVDCISLLILAEEVEKFNKNEQKIIPRFFESSPILRAVIKETGFIDKLEYLYDNTSSSVLRDADYFIFKAIFNKNAQLLTNRNEYQEYLDNIIEARNKLQFLYKTEKCISDEAISQIFIQANLEVLAHNLSTFTFFQTVLLPYLNHQEIKLDNLTLTKIVRKLKNKSFKNSINDEIKKITERLEDNVQHFQIINNMWELLESNISLRKEKYSKIPFTKINFRGFGLNRFSLPGEKNDELFNFFFDLFDQDENKTKGNVAKLVAIYYDIKILNKKVSDDDLTKLFSILWILKMDDIIIDLMQKQKNRLHYSFIILNTASYLRSNKNMNIGLEQIVVLENRFKRARKSEDKINLAVGLAYLSFHSWLLNPHRSNWRTSPDQEKNVNYTFKEKETLDKAIKYADYASKKLNIDCEKKIYSINQKLYYMVEAGCKSKVNDMKEVAQELVKLKQPAYWSFRYEDTLSRYFLFLYKIASDPDMKKATLNDADWHLKECLKNGGSDDDEVLQYRTEFDIFTTL